MLTAVQAKNGMSQHFLLAITIVFEKGRGGGVGFGVRC